MMSRNVRAHCFKVRVCGGFQFVTTFFFAADRPEKRTRFCAHLWCNWKNMEMMECYLTREKVLRQPHSKNPTPLHTPTPHEKSNISIWSNPVSQNDEKQALLWICQAVTNQNKSCCFDLPHFLLMYKEVNLKNEGELWRSFPKFAEITLMTSSSRDYSFCILEGEKGTLSRKFRQTSSDLVCMSQTRLPSPLQTVALKEVLWILGVCVLTETVPHKLEVWSLKKLYLNEAGEA